MSQRRLLPSEIQFLQKAMSADFKNANVRLREGEYQYGLVKVIASFQLELYFPDVKDVIKRLYGEEKANDLQFVRKIQTVLKKMEKSDVMTILPKRKPWELQRYALLSFKFQDSDRNSISLATDQQIDQARNLLKTSLSQREETRMNYLKLVMTALFTVASYVVTAWALLRPIVSPIVFVSALAISVVCSLTLGKILSQESS